MGLLPRRRPSPWQFATAGLSNAPAAKLERDRQITQKHGGPWATACGMLSKGPPGENFDGARRCVCPRAADQLLAERKMSKSDSAAAPSAGQSVTHPLAPWLSKRAPPNGSKIRGGRRELLRAKSRPRGRLLRPAASNLGVFGARRVAARSFRTQTRQASVFFFFLVFGIATPSRTPFGGAGLLSPRSGEQGGRWARGFGRRNENAPLDVRRRLVANRLKFVLRGLEPFGRGSVRRGVKIAS
ncbi:hypothetical protein ERJ75_000069600 [Trypanosoma vivax]|nr:hypothetical protein ERJ75_000555300 [Trypanosoma vivax]KAH8620384.1 hypothetical protein ERJ75_000069600 [Trypanosoma vivax]